MSQDRRAVGITVAVTPKQRGVLMPIERDNDTRLDFISAFLFSGEASEIGNEREPLVTHHVRMLHASYERLGVASGMLFGAEESEPDNEAKQRVQDRMAECEQALEKLPRVAAARLCPALPARSLKIFERSTFLEQMKALALAGRGQVGIYTRLG